MFDITDGKGFQVTFENGWTVSVQFGTVNYCDNRDIEGQYGYAGKSNTAEIAAWDSEGKYHDFDGNDKVAGWQTPAQVLDFMNMIAAKDAT